MQNDAETSTATPPDLAAEYRRDGGGVARSVLDRAQLAALAAAVEENLAAPGPWAIDYTPAGSTGRFFGDYVNWERIDGYRHAALEGPLPQLARKLLGEAPRFFHEHTLVKEGQTHEVTR